MQRKRRIVEHFNSQALYFYDNCLFYLFFCQQLESLCQKFSSLTTTKKFLYFPFAFLHIFLIKVQSCANYANFLCYIIGHFNTLFTLQLSISVIPVLFQMLISKSGELHSKCFHGILQRLCVSQFKKALQSSVKFYQCLSKIS